MDQVRELLDLGADPNTVLNQPGDTAFREWVGTNFMRNYVDSTPGLTVLMLASGMKQCETVKLLLDYGANKNLATHGKSSLLALYFAAWADSPETIQVLLGDAPSKDDVRIEVSLDEQRARYYRSGQLVLSRRFPPDATVSRPSRASTSSPTSISSITPRSITTPACPISCG